MTRAQRWRAVASLSAIAVVAATLLPARPGFGQQGHPLTGSWHGEWGPAGDRTDLTLIVSWDGQQLTGLVNPVTDRTRLQNVALDSGSWTVRFEVDVTGQTEQMLHCTADGRLERLGSDRRTLVGTWNCGDLKSGFELTRDRDY